MAVRSFWLSLLSLLGVLALAGCDDAASGGCVEDRECELPLSCIEGECQIECRITPDCQRGEICLENVCRTPATSCSSDFECADFGQVCDLVLGQCVAPGTQRCHETLNPCPAGELCAAGACRLPTDDAARPTPDAAVSDAAIVTPDGALPLDAAMVEADGEVVSPDAAVPDAGFVPGTGVYGDECTCGSDCASGWCVQNKLRGTKVCTQTCGGAGNRPDDFLCPELDTCFDVAVAAGGECPPVPNGPAVGTIVPVCVPNETGLACTVPANCSSGLCITPPGAEVALPNAHGMCSVACVDNRKCPDGYRCGPTGNGVQACVPDVDIAPCQGNVQTCGGVCPGAPSPDDLLCLSNAGGGFCSCTCTTAADCPVGFACDAADDRGTAARPNICKPLSGYVCPNGDPNAISDECYAGLCLILDNPLLNRCSALCDADNDCPNQHVCADLGAGGRVCLPLAWSLDLD